MELFRSLRCWGWYPWRHFTRTCAERQVVADSTQPSRTYRLLLLIISRFRASKSDVQLLCVVFSWWHGVLFVIVLKVLKSVQNIVYLQWMWIMIVFVDCACHLEANYCRFSLPPVRIRRNLPSSYQKSRIACQCRWVMHEISARIVIRVKVDPWCTWELVIRPVRPMTGCATLVERCRKIVHHFVMFHCYRSGRGPRRFAFRSAGEECRSVRGSGVLSAGLSPPARSRHRVGHRGVLIYRRVQAGAARGTMSRCLCVRRRCVRACIER